MKRRDFLISGFLTAPALAAKVSPLSLINYKPLNKLSPDLRISFQDDIAPGRTPEERFDFMESYGITGFEPRGTDLIKNVNKYVNSLRYRNIKISAVQSGYKGFIFSGNRALRNQNKCIMKEMIAAAGEFGSTGVITIPATSDNYVWNSAIPDLYKNAVDELIELAMYAEKHNTSVIIKPVNGKETDWIRTVRQASDICRSFNLKGLKCMADFWHMTDEEVSDMDAIDSGKGYLCHIHIASRKSRDLPGTDGTADNYTEGFRGLKKIKYDGYISYVCGISGDKNRLLPASLSFLNYQWLLV